MRPAVVGDDLEAACDEAIDHASAAAAIIGNPMKENNQRLRPSGGETAPTARKFMAGLKARRYVRLLAPCFSLPAPRF